MSIRAILLSALSALLLTPPATAQEIPPYNPQGARQVCTETPILDRPGGTPTRQAQPGESVTPLGVDFTADGQLYFQIEEDAENRFVSAADLRHSCAFASRRDARPLPFLAPPNSCHVIVASRKTLAEVNDIAAEYAAYADQMSVFRAKNGWYAVSVGMVSNGAAPEVLRDGKDIPEDAYCADGANYFDLLDRVDGRFVELDPPAPADPNERMAEAVRLKDSASGDSKAATLRRACLMGSHNACGLHAEAINMPGQNAGNGAEIVRDYLLGCMLGNAVPCNNAVAIKLDSVDQTMFTALPDRISAASVPPMMKSDLLMTACDADVAFSCQLLFMSLLPYGTSNDIGAQIVAFESALKACRLEKGFNCDSLAQVEDLVLAQNLSPTASLVLGRLYMSDCTPDDRKTRNQCSSAFGHASRLLASAEGSSDDRAAAQSALRAGCAAGHTYACLSVGNLRESFPTEERRQAATRLAELCAPQTEKDGACRDIATLVDTGLPEAQAALRAKYDEYAQACRTEERSDQNDDCSSALIHYAKHLATVDMAEPLALLNDTCRPGKISGCNALAGYYAGNYLSLRDPAPPGWVEQPDLALAAMKTGCIPTLEGVSSCGSLGLTYEGDGDFQAAAAAYKMGCETGMQARADQYYGQDRVCSWAAKNARVNSHDYADARRWFRYLCERDDPYSCKFLGLMYAQGEGADPDPLAALRLYQIACNMEEIPSGDGQACMLQAQVLMELRETLARDGGDYLPLDAIPAADRPDDVVAQNVTDASRGFLLGCMDDYPESCAAHAKLLTDWTAAAYPRDPAPCRLADTEGRLGPEKQCEAFDFYLPEPEGIAERGPARVFVWPDGDRTVIVADGAPRLNGANGSWYEPEGEWGCVKSEKTERSFCF